MKSKDYYLGLDYEIVVRKLSHQDGGGFFAYYKDFKGVMGDGEVEIEAIKDAKEAFSIFLDTALKDTLVIKEPSHLKKAKRINITIPADALEKIDSYVKKRGINRSSFFKESALQALKS